MPTLTAIPGRVLDQTLKLWRLPLDLATSRLRPDAEETAWPPLMLVERFEATARETVGTLLHDDRLLDRARLQRTRIHQLERARVIDVEASTKAEQADQTLQQRREAAEEQRTSAARTADEREQALQREQQTRKADARKAAAAKKQKARERADAKAKATRAREDAATRARLDQQAAALAEEEQAVDEKARALDLQDEAEKAKVARKAR